jgi:hypothetical protein
MQAAIITASATVVVAVLAFLLNLYSQMHLERRQGHLARVNSQLRNLYGPLCALVDVNEWIWEAMRANGLPRISERSAETLERDWAAWRDEFLMPTNIRMRDLIMGHADLLAEAEFPAALRGFCAHVGSCEVILAESASGVPEGGRRAAFHIQHPGSEFVDYVRRSFTQLKAEQQRLLNPQLIISETGWRPSRDWHSAACKARYGQGAQYEHRS